MCQAFACRFRGIGRIALMLLSSSLILMSSSLPPSFAQGPTTYYVATNGNNSWSGTLASPTGNDGPFAGASISGRVASGSRAGRRTAKVGDAFDLEDMAIPSIPRCATIAGFSVHANVGIPGQDRMRLERLCRYAGRPPVATERLSRLSGGKLLYRLKRRWRDGTTHLIFEPLELVEKGTS